MNRFLACTAGLLTLIAASAAHAGSVGSAVITVGNHDLLPNTPGQQIQIQVLGDLLVQGLNFYAQVEDGGPLAGGSILGPAITAGDILTGTIFALSNTGQGGAGVGAGIGAPQVFEATTTTQDPDTVFTNGLLVTLEISTVGFNTGVFDLLLTNTLLGNTNFADDLFLTQLSITNGTITITGIVVPTPTAAGGMVAMGMMLGVGRLFARRR